MPSFQRVGADAFLTAFASSFHRRFAIRVVGRHLHVDARVAHFAHGHAVHVLYFCPLTARQVTIYGMVVDASIASWVNNVQHGSARFWAQVALFMDLTGADFVTAQRVVVRVNPLLFHVYSF